MRVSKLIGRQPCIYNRLLWSMSFSATQAIRWSGASNERGAYTWYRKICCHRLRLMEQTASNFFGNNNNQKKKDERKSKTKIECPQIFDRINIRQPSAGNIRHAKIAPAKQSLDTFSRWHRLQSEFKSHPFIISAQENHSWNKYQLLNRLENYVRYVFRLFFSLQFPFHSDVMVAFSWYASAMVFDVDSELALVRFISTHSQCQTHSNLLVTRTYWWIWR